MKLGILVSTDKRADDIIGLTKSALSKGHEVTIFIMDSGVNLLGNTAVTGLSSESGVKMSFCDHSTQKVGISKEGIPDNVAAASQYDNAVMNQEVDRVINL